MLLQCQRRRQGPGRESQQRSRRGRGEWDRTGYIYVATCRGHLTTLSPLLTGLSEVHTYLHSVKPGGTPMASYGLDNSAKVVKLY